MITEELLDYITKQSSIITKIFGSKDTEKEIVLARTVKLNEEVGELCGEILAYFKEQRKEKLEKERELEHEFADVIITTLLLADSMEIDIKEALKTKIEKIKLRFKEEFENLE